MFIGKGTMPVAGKNSQKSQFTISNDYNADFREISCRKGQHARCAAVRNSQKPAPYSIYYTK